MNAMAKNYEALFMLKPAEEEDLKKVVTQITEGIKKDNGKIIKIDSWGKKALAYPIKKQQEAVYYKLDFSIDPSLIEKLEKGYRLNNSILRTLIIKR